MERSEFLKLLGVGTALACAGCMASCADNSDPAPANVDFTIDISTNENAVLTSAGGSAIRNKIYIARLTVSTPAAATDFTAVSSICTHEQTTVNYISAQQNFLCPNHQSKFDKNGAVLNGPATKALHKYNTVLTGNSLRVFS